MNSAWQPFREPLWATLARNGAIAIALGAVLAYLSGGGLPSWPLASLLALWPALGGHCVELVFLYWLRPRLPAKRWAQVMARLVIWFTSGCGLAAAMAVTAQALGGPYPPRWPLWWVGGAAFIGIELVAHLVLQLRGSSSFYNGRG